MYVFHSRRRRSCEGEWVRRLGLGFTNPVETGGVWDVCLSLGCGDCVCLGGQRIGGLVQSLGGWGGVMSVLAVSLDYLCIVLDGYLRIVCGLVFNPVALYRYLLPSMYLSEADIANPDFIGCYCRTSFDLSRFYEE